MKFMLMMNTPGNGPYQVGNWPRKDLEAHINFMKDFATKLQSNGELISAQATEAICFWTLLRIPRSAQKRNQ